jgi:hypothetical protein
MRAPGFWFTRPTGPPWPRGFWRPWAGPMAPPLPGGWPAAPATAPACR